MNNETKYIKELKSADGWKFYLLENGTVIDNLNAELVDMTYKSEKDFNEYDKILSCLITE